MPYVDRSSSNTNRFDLISCDLNSEPYVHMIKTLKFGTNFDYAYSNDPTGNVTNSNWILEVGNVDLLQTYFERDLIKNLKVKIVLGHLLKYYFNLFKYLVYIYYYVCILKYKIRTIINIKIIIYFTFIL